MAKRIGNFTIYCENNPSVLSYAAVGGHNEGQGALGQYFDIIHNDPTLGKKSWEEAESEMQKQAVERAIAKASLYPKDIDCIFSGDLLNQCTGGSFGLLDLNIPFLGQFGACSTMAQTFSMASLFIEGGLANKCIAVTSSHFCTAERQFRYPLDYGSVKTPTSQWTATASGSVVVGKGGIVKVKSVTIGRINDMGITDCNNMGAAMAPAATDTLTNFFTDTHTNADNYDRIYTGDLGKVGSKLFYELMLNYGFSVESKHSDCGMILFDLNNKKVCAGGSGCGCSASVLCTKILPEMEAGQMNDVLFMATGALLSQTSTQQGQNIPAIAHLIHLSTK